MPVSARKNTTAVLGVVFPSVKKYLPDYFNSLENQTCKDFDLIVLNDGLDDFGYSPAFEVTVIPGSGTPAAIREYGINSCLKAGYERLVFTDTDDYYAQDRLERSLELLRDHDVVVNDVALVSEGGKQIENKYLSGRVDELNEIDIDFILNKNVFGFSNTAFNMSCLQGPVSFHRDLVAVDWHFFSKLLLKGCRAVFTGETLSYYRQHGENTVGLGGPADRESLLRAVDVKALHYDVLSGADDRFASLAEEFKELKNALKNSDNITAYMADVRENRPEHPLWWEDAMPWRKGIK